MFAGVLSILSMFFANIKIRFADSKAVGLPVNPKRTAGMAKTAKTAETQNNLKNSAKNAIIKSSNDLKQTFGDYDVPKEYHKNYEDFQRLTITREAREVLKGLHEKSLADGFEHGAVTV